MTGPGPGISPPPASSALLTDHYELTMVDTALRSGVAENRAVFEVFARRLPAGRRFGIVAGLGRLVDELAAYRFGSAELDHLARHRVVSEAGLDWLAAYRFSGTVLAYAEGEPYFARSPLLTIDAPLAQGLVLETLVLSVLNHDSAVAAAGARMVAAAAGRPLIEAGSRRTHERAAPAAARAAYLVGFAATSNLEAGRRFDVPTGGTAAHALVLAHPDEATAFAAQVDALGAATTLLVDTYDIEVGIRRAVAAAGPGLGAVRIDSGDLAAEARRARALLDELGARGTAVVISGDLDEHGIAALAGAPVDRMLVGTELVMGSGHPTAGLVYKLVAVAEEPGIDAPLRAVAKRSAGKADPGGRTFAARVLGPDGHARVEVVVGDPARLDELAERSGMGPDRVRLLQDVVVEGGVATGALRDLERARSHHRRALAELGPPALDLAPGEAALTVTRLG